MGYDMELAPRIELGSHPYQGRVLPLYYASIIRLNLPTYLDDSDILFRGLVKPGMLRRLELTPGIEPGSPRYKGGIIPLY